MGARSRGAARMLGVAAVTAARIPNNVNANFNWIWFVGAAAWFLDAALILHRGALGRGLLSVVVSAIFLAAGMFFRKQAGR
jgi:hypothetical protein